VSNAVGIVESHNYVVVLKERSAFLFFLLGRSEICLVVDIWSLGGVIFITGGAIGRSAVK
jgi:hypothetical protein